MLIRAGPDEFGVPPVVRRGRSPSARSAKCSCGVEIAEFISCNLPFVEQAALIGLEMMGFARANIGHKV